MVRGQDFKQLKEAEYRSSEIWLQEGRSLHDQTVGRYLSKGICRLVSLFSRKPKEDIDRLEGIGHSA